MDSLTELVKGAASGDRLLGALHSSNLSISSELPQLIAAAIKEKLTAASNSGGPGAGPTSLGDALCVIDGLMFLNPRGKQQLALFKDRCVVRTAKGDIVVPWAAIHHVAIIDSIPGDSKNRVLLYLHVASDAKVMNGKTPLTALVIQTTADGQLDVAHPQGEGRLQGAAPVVLCQALGAVSGGVDPASFISPDAQLFQSASKAAGVAAHVKARQGFLYPLPSALCFLESPALFLPHSSIRSVELMRAGGGSSTFDLVVHLKGGGLQEFGMVAREELAAMQGYLRKCRLALGGGESSDEEGGEEGDQGAAEDGDSDDPEDEDFNPLGSSDEEEAVPRQQPAKRKRVAMGGAAHDCAAGGGSAAVTGGQEVEEKEGAGSALDSQEEQEEDSSEDEDSDEGDDAVEIVSEDEFSRGQLQGLIAEEGSTRKRRRT